MHRLAGFFCQDKHYINVCNMILNSRRCRARDQWFIIIIVIVIAVICRRWKIAESSILVRVGCFDNNWRYHRNTNTLDQFVNYSAILSRIRWKNFSLNAMSETHSKFWLLTFDCFKKDVKKPEDNLIILVHWLLLNNGFKVLGSGNEVKFLLSKY